MNPCDNVYKATYSLHVDYAQDDLDLLISVLSGPEYCTYLLACQSYEQQFHKIATINKKISFIHTILDISVVRGKKLKTKKQTIFTL